MCPDGGGVVLGLKDQPVVDEQKGLGGGSASCPGPDLLLSTPMACLLPGQAVPTSPGSRPRAPALGPSWPWWGFQGAASSPAAQAPGSFFLSFGSQRPSKAPGLALVARPMDRAPGTTWWAQGLPGGRQGVVHLLRGLLLV